MACWIQDRGGGRMRLERIANWVPRFVAQTTNISKIQVNKTSVSFEGASDCVDFSFTDLKVDRKAQA